MTWRVGVEGQNQDMGRSAFLAACSGNESASGSIRMLGQFCYWQQQDRGPLSFVGCPLGGGLGPRLPASLPVPSM